MVGEEESLGVGGFGVWGRKEGERWEVGSECGGVFLRGLVGLVKGERRGKEIIDEIWKKGESEG